MKALKNLFTVLVAGIFVLLTTGCQFSGGGHLPSLLGEEVGTPGKATFAMHGFAELDDEVGIVTAGNGQYNDHAVGVKFHLDVTGELGCGVLEEPIEGDLIEWLFGCITSNIPEFSEEDIERIAFAYGNYTPQPKKIGPGGCFVALVLDSGEPGNGGDILAIGLSGGVYDGYINCGVIEGGNIKTELLILP